ncbi:MAG TPA: preprotein translocase subunit YajC [Acidimicrobiales bacterium]
MEFLIIVAATFLLLWLLFIRPQQRRVREHQRLVESLQVGDEVVLTAGIFGKITALRPEELELEVSPGVELRVARPAVLRKVETLSEALGDDTDAVVEADSGATGEPTPPDAGRTPPPGRDAPPGDQP